MNARDIPEPEGWEDALTGLEGPDLWQRVLVTEVTRAVRYGRALTVVVAQVEGISEMGDQWGTEIARHSLREMGQCLRRLTRTSDYCTRIGLARFGVVLTETNEVEAINFVERARLEAPATLPRSGDGLRLAFGWASPQGRRVAGCAGAARGPPPDAGAPQPVGRGAAAGAADARAPVPRGPCRAGRPYASMVTYSFRTVSVMSQRPDHPTGSTTTEPADSSRTDPSRSVIRAAPRRTWTISVFGRSSMDQPPGVHSQIPTCTGPDVREDARPRRGFAAVCPDARSRGLERAEQVRLGRRHRGRAGS